MTDLLIIAVVLASVVGVLGLPLAHMIHLDRKDTRP